jgi:hypothetical protein
MPPTQTITLFHSPKTRSSGTLALLEELNAPYKLELPRFGGQFLVFSL